MAGPPWVGAAWGAFPRVGEAAGWEPSRARTLHGCRCSPPLPSTSSSPAPRSSAAGGRLLLVRRATWDTLPGHWELPGGKVGATEPPESAKATAVSGSSRAPALRARRETQTEGREVIERNTSAV